MDEDRAFRLVVIGAGKMARRHLEAFSAIEGVELVGIASRSGTTARALAEQFSIEAWSDDWRSLLDQARPDACVVCVSHALNEEITAAVVARGIHVLAEKPVAMGSDGALRLAEAARRQGVVAMVAMNRRFFPAVSSALATIHYAGKLRGVTVVAPDPSGPPRANGKYPAFVYDNWFMMNTIHAVDLLRLVGGEVDHVAAVAQDHADGASICATMRFDSGAAGSFVSHSSLQGGSPNWELWLHGEGVEVRLQGLEQGFEVFDGGALSASTPEASADADGLRAQAIAFVETVRAGVALSRPACDIGDHAGTLKLVEDLLAGNWKRTPGPPAPGNDGRLRNDAY